MTAGGWYILAMKFPYDLGEVVRKAWAFRPTRRVRLASSTWAIDSSYEVFYLPEGLRIKGLGFRGFRVQGFEFVGFRVQGRRAPANIPQKLQEDLYVICTILYNSSTSAG